MKLSWENKEEPCVILGNIHEPDTWRFLEPDEQINGMIVQMPEMFSRRFESKGACRRWVLAELSKRTEILNKAYWEWERMGRSRVSNHPHHG